MKKFLLLASFTSILLMVIPATPLAAPTPDMFAYGMKIDADGDNAFNELELPIAVYKALTSKELYDIRIFSAEGSIAPHALHRPDNRTHQEDAIQADLPFFPLTSSINSSDNDINIHIKKDELGMIIDVKTTHGDDQAFAEHKVAAYLIDSGKLKGKPISALELEWSADQADFMGKIYVEESRDLNRWKRVANATIARLDYGNYRLDRKKLPLSITGKAYLRLSWPKGQDAFALTKVVALANQTYTLNQPDYRWTKAVVLPLSGKPGHYTIDLGGFLPADKVRIRLKDRNSMAGVRLYSGCSEKENNTTEQWRGLVYNLDYRDTSFHNSIINIRETGARYWLLTVDEREMMPLNLPNIEFGWQPHRLTFLARGNGPFYIAYGSVDAPRPDFKVDLLLHNYQQESKNIRSGRGTLGPQYLLGGIDRLLPDPPSLPWKKYILWAALFAGVLAIGWMSVTLFRQLQVEKNRVP